VWNLVSDTKGRTWTEGVSEKGAKENTGPKRDEVTMKVE
jgi:hypothetical protein